MALYEDMNIGNLLAAFPADLASLEKVHNEVRMNHIKYFLTIYNDKMKLEIEALQRDKAQVASSWDNFEKNCQKLQYAEEALQRERDALQREREDLQKMREEVQNDKNVLDSNWETYYKMTRSQNTQNVAANCVVENEQMCNFSIPSGAIRGTYSVSDKKHQIETELIRLREEQTDALVYFFSHHPTENPDNNKEIRERADKIALLENDLILLRQ